tara:strand:+ start:354 stop:656 length:303 start_codon:yes stop_codon:yes gene_type:complete
MNRIRNQQIKKSINQKRYYKYLKYPEIPISIEDVYIITKTGDRTDLMAFNYYGNSDLWWVLVKANPNKLKRDSFFIPVGIQIRIPSNIEGIIDKFENENS